MGADRPARQTAECQKKRHDLTMFSSNYVLDCHFVFYSDFVPSLTEFEGVFFAVPLRTEGQLNLF